MSGNDLKKRKQRQGWKTVIDFTKIQQGGVLIDDVLLALERVKNITNNDKIIVK
jgi:hypothetical protein